MQSAAFIKGFEKKNLSTPQAAALIMLHNCFQNETPGEYPEKLLPQSLKVIGNIGQVNAESKADQHAANRGHSVLNVMARIAAKNKQV